MTLKNFPVAYGSPLVEPERSVQSTKPVYALFDPNAMILEFLRLYKETFGIEYPMKRDKDWHAGRSMFKAYIDRWGSELGGQMMAKFFEEGGRYKGDPATMSMFSLGWRWLHDQLYVKVMEDQPSERELRSTARMFPASALFGPLS